MNEVMSELDVGDEIRCNDNGNGESSRKCNRFAEWLHCICVVQFDLELGQAMEIIYPETAKLSDSEKTNICYLAFPDSNSGCMGDTKFHVRLRVQPATETTLLGPVHRRYNGQCIPVQRADSGHYWGFVYFRQIRDATLPRGYFQKSVVLLSRLPFINLFDELCTVIAQRYFDFGIIVLETVCDMIDNWPSISCGRLLELPVFDHVYHIRLPYRPSQRRADDNFNEPDEWTEEQPSVIYSVHEVNIYESLSCVLSQLHLLWELVLIGEPIVVIAASPTNCSAMVQSLVSMIAPLQYGAECRPYFTIHDSEFREFTQRTAIGPPPAIILGVTNPFFTKTLQHWPHTIRLADQTSTQPSSLVAAQQKLQKIIQTPRFLDTEPGVYTEYKPFLVRDKEIQKKVLSGQRMHRPGNVQSAILRRHLLELTESFMIPLERYMATLLPFEKDIQPFKAVPSLGQFKQDDFLATLSNSGPQLTSKLKGNWQGLYKRFFRSANFKLWYDNRYAELMQTVQARQLQALSEADLNKWVQGKHEVEIVDMILKLKHKLEILDPDQSADVPCLFTLTTDTRQQLFKHLTDMKNLLPDDLKAILK